jgi:diacylglycerol kinase (ATP)
MQQRRFSAIIRCGSTVHRVRTVQITIGNGRLYSGAMAPGAPDHADENRLSVYSLEPRARWGLMFMSKLFGGQQAPETLTEVRTAASAVIEVVTRMPQPISADGEVVTVTPARFSMMPRAVRVYAPAVEPAPRWDGSRDEPRDEGPDTTETA